MALVCILFLSTLQAWLSYFGFNNGSGFYTLSYNNFANKDFWLAACKSALLERKSALAAYISLMTSILLNYIKELTFKNTIIQK